MTHEEYLKERLEVVEIEQQKAQIEKEKAEVRFMTRNEMLVRERMSIKSQLREGE